LIKILKEWFHRYFSNPEAVLLFFVLIFGFGLIILLGGILAPVLASIVIAYLLEWAVNHLEKYKIPRLVSVWIVFLGFLSILLVFLIFLSPLIWRQLVSLFQDLPDMITKSQQTLMTLTIRFPAYFSEEQLNSMLSSMMVDVRSWGKVVLAASLASITSLILWIVYLVLVPLMVFFFLKDRQVILNWVGNLLPHKRGVLRQVSSEVNMQIGNYIRGKVVEIIVVGIATYIVFWYFGLNYAALLATLVGLSVLIPYVGAVVITIPVALVGDLQWGLTPQFGYMMIAYLVVQGLDANILVPLLFSEAVNLHPIVIIIATLFFGGIWGFWGVFFAIPLATLFKAVFNAWPRSKPI
jgi:putative permease